MRSLHYTLNQFDTKDAHDLCMELEAALGVNLCVKDAKHPNDVHGCLNTDSDGNVEIFLYDAVDVDAIARMAPNKRSDSGIYKVSPISQAAASAAAVSVLSKRGLKP